MAAIETYTEWYCRNREGYENQWPSEEVARRHVLDRKNALESKDAPESTYKCTLVKKVITIEVYEVDSE